MHLPSRQVLLPLFAVLALVTIAYANHFHNDFHFDDFHTITTNPYIRDLRNIPLIFEDADTFSTLPANRAWRPLVTTSLAIDYALAKGLKPGYFQASDFFWFLVQLCLMFALFRHILDFARPHPLNRYFALFAVALYGVHPAIAETVNYIIQRGDIYSTLGVVAGLLIYIRWPHRRGQGLYLVPVGLALLSKPPALVFPAILFAYLLLFEDERPVRALARSIPALLLSIGLGALANAMTPKSFDPGAWPAHDYRITQPLVALRYFRSFFLPLHLNVDTDHIAETSIFHGYAWAGVIFVIALIAAAIYTGRRRELRPIAFGIWWFILALLPTSWFPLAEIENDHRMYFPFVGLVLSLVYAASLLIQRAGWLRKPVPVAVACGLILALAAQGTWRRNIVWHNEESLWYDVTLKSPQNGRGLMNYGLTQMEKGDYVRALNYFTRALEFSPEYYVLEINLGIANGALNRDDEAERHFARSIELAPTDAQTLYFYASWLRDRGRYSEAIQDLNTDIENNPAYLDARYLLMWIYHDLGDNYGVEQTARALLAQFPTDSVAQTWLAGKTPAR
jgi:tetratricopeptide (TPR) repeat protein